MHHISQMCLIIASRVQARVTIQCWLVIIIRLGSVLSEHCNEWEPPFTTYDILNMIFSVTYCLGLHVPISFYYSSIFSPSKMLMFYSVQTTNLVVVGKK